MTIQSPTSPSNPTMSTVGLPIIHAETGDPPTWASEHRAALRAIVHDHGSVLVRGLGLRDPDEVAAVFRLVGGELMSESEAFAARRTYSDGVYSSPTWPSNQPMCQHHELSYRLQTPGLLLLCCLTPAETGGAVGVADATVVLDALPPDLVARFERHGWLLTRTYNDDIGASIADAFGTDDRAAVERYCQTNGIAYEWLAEGGLRTRQQRPAVVRHPGDGRRCWFNQVAFLSEWTMDPEVREYLVEVYGADRLPFTTSFGNGDPIGADVVRLLNEVYDGGTVRVPWQAGDLLLVDNIRTAHGREPYEGDHEVLVAMAEPVQLSAEGQAIAWYNAGDFAGTER